MQGCSRAADPASIGKLLLLLCNCPIPRWRPSETRRPEDRPAFFCSAVSPDREPAGIRVYREEPTRAFFLHQNCPGTIREIGRWPLRPCCRKLCPKSLSRGEPAPEPDGCR